MTLKSFIVNQTMATNWTCVYKRLVTDEHTSINIFQIYHKITFSNSNPYTRFYNCKTFESIANCVSGNQSQTHMHAYHRILTFYYFLDTKWLWLF